MTPILRMLPLLAALSFGAAHAGPSFTVCSHNLPPHTYPDAEGRPSGFASEVLLEIARRLGWQLTVEYMTWMRARVETEGGRCDLLYTILKKPEYEEFAQFPEQALADRYNVLIVRKGSGITYDGDLEAFMRRHAIGLYKDKAVSPLFDQLKQAPWARLEYPMTAESVMKMLLGGRFDAAIENRATAVHELQTLGKLDAVEILAPPLLITPAYIAFARKGKALPQIGEFDRALKAFKSSRDYTALLVKYNEPVR